MMQFVMGKSDPASAGKYLQMPAVPTFDGGPVHAIGTQSTRMAGADGGYSPAAAAPNSSSAFQPTFNTRFPSGHSASGRVSVPPISVQGHSDSESNSSGGSNSSTSLHQAAAAGPLDNPSVHNATQLRPHQAAVGQRQNGFEFSRTHVNTTPSGRQTGHVSLCFTPAHAPAASKNLYNNYNGSYDNTSKY